MLTRSRQFALALFGCAALAVGLGWLFYPQDKTPEGAYLRVMSAVNSGKPEALFPYVETEAQHAAFTIHSYANKSLALVQAHYPESVRGELEARLNELAIQEAGPGVFAVYALRYGWLNRLRRDLSGVKSVEVNGPRATVETVRGTRYPFRQRDNGIWGLTWFTARLVSDAEKAARDFVVIEEASKDYAASSSVKER